MRNNGDVPRTRHGVDKHGVNDYHKWPLTGKISSSRQTGWRTSKATVNDVCLLIPAKNRFVYKSQKKSITPPGQSPFGPSQVAKLIPGPDLVGVEHFFRSIRDYLQDLSCLGVLAFFLPLAGVSTNQKKIYYTPRTISVRPISSGKVDLRTRLSGGIALF